MIEITQVIVTNIECDGPQGVGIITRPQIPKNAILLTKTAKGDAKMTSRDFCYWLQGLFELQNPKELGILQTAAIKQHLAMVFKHEIDPSMGPPEHQAVLDAIHKVAPTPPPMPLSGSVVVQHGYRPGGYDSSGQVMRC